MLNQQIAGFSQLFPINEIMLLSNNLPKVLANVKKFRVTRKSILRVVTSFELVDGLWLTDSTFTHEGLVVAETGKHREFPGPSLWHLRKDSQT